MTNSNQISIIIPCHHVDRRVLRSIESAQWADEVLIIDQNSNIDWSDLKKKFKFELIKHPSLTSFSEMKNQALKRVKTQWVFFLDSDEYITHSLATEIQQKIKNTTSDGFLVKRVDIFLNKVLRHGETKNADFIRLIRVGKGEWQGAVHEKLVFHNKDQQPVRLETELFHEPHPSIAEFIQKVNTYTSLLALQKNESHLMLKSLIFPLLKFLYTFILKKGFLDGYRGLVYSFIMSVHSSTVRIKRYETA